MTSRNTKPCNVQFDTQKLIDFKSQKRKRTRPKLMLIDTFEAFGP